MSRINENLIQSIGVQFRVRREKLLYTQKDIAYMTGLTINTIAAVEKGRSTTVNNFLLICRALKMQPKTIFEEDIELIPPNVLEPESKRRIESTKKLYDLVFKSNFFDSPRRVSEVLAKLEFDKNDSNKISVYLTGYCKDGILEYEKSGNFKWYVKKEKQA